MIVADIVAGNKRRQFTAHEIAEIIMKKETDFCLRKIKRTGKTEKILLFQLMSEIGAQYPKMINYDVGQTETRPFKYFYQKKTKFVPQIIPAAGEQSAKKPVKQTAVKTVKKTVKKTAKKVCKKK